MILQRGFDILSHIQSKPKNEVLFAHKKKGEWVYYSSEDYISMSEYTCLGLHLKGIKKGDLVVSMTNDRPEWNFIDIGIQMAGGIHVPMPITASDEEVEHILIEAESKLIFVSSKLVFTRIRKITQRINITSDIYTITDIRNVTNYSEIVNLGKSTYDPLLLEKLKSSVTAEDTAAILYTSGTSSKPKGVMITHRNLASMPEIFAHALPFDSSLKRALSVIPLSHIAGRKNNFVYQYLGLSVYYGEPGADIVKIYEEVNPDITVLVPLQLERIYRRLTTPFGNHKFISALLKYGINLTQSFSLDKKIPILTRIQLDLANRLFYSRRKRLLGDRLKFIICGGAAVPEHLLKFFWAINLPVYEIYGMTETSALISVNKPGKIKFGTVGEPYKQVVVKLKEDGELMCKGPNIMKGYFLQPVLTKNAIDKEGFFHTGDICQIDGQGFIKITGRKKEIFKTASGEFVVPEIIENKLKRSAFIKHIIIIGENRTFLSAIIVPQIEILKAWAETHNVQCIEKDEFLTDEAIMTLYRIEIEKFNDSLMETHFIKKFMILNHNWSAESGELSSFMKPKRKFILEKYSQEIEGFYV